MIEPIAIQLSYEFTFKLLTPREIGYGNKIEFTANLLQYATLQTRDTIGGNMFDRGAMTINEYRALMYYGPVDDGDVRMVSLNYVKAGDQSLYQVGQGGGSSDPPPDPRDAAGQTTQGNGSRRTCLFSDYERGLRICRKHQAF